MAVYCPFGALYQIPAPALCLLNGIVTGSHVRCEIDTTTTLLTVCMNALNDAV